MATPEAEEAAARVIERLLVDPGFRADFRRDPATACREAGLDDLAEEMSYGAGKAMYTLDIRESRSSLAGVMMAAAFEGMGVFGLSEHVVPGIVGAPASVRNVLSRVNIPKVDAPDVHLPSVDLRGKLAAGEQAAPPAPAASGAGEVATAGAPAAPGAPASASASPAAAAPPAPAAAPPASASGEPAADAKGPSTAGDSKAAPPAGEKPAPEQRGFSAAGGDSKAASSAAEKPAAKDGFSAAGDSAAVPAGAPKDGFSAAGDTAAPPAGAPKDGFSAAGDAAAPAGDKQDGFAAVSQAEPAPSADAPEPQAAAPPPEPRASSTPVDAAQLGRDGTGGPPNAEALALLDNKNVELDSDGIADIKEGRIDPRIVAVLTKLSEDHKIKISCMCRDHPVNTTGGSVSNHNYGRGMDIASIDGEIVNGGSGIAREIAGKLSELDPKYRPNEIGTPWAINAPGYFTDADHQDHLHVAFKDAIAPSWNPPADVAAGGSAAAGAAVAAPGATPAPPDRDTISFKVVDGGPAKANDTLTFSAVSPADVAEKAAATPAAAAASATAPPAEGAAAPAAATPAAQAASAGAPAAAAASTGADPALSSSLGEAAAEQLARDGVTQPAGTKALAALAEALKYKGTPYLWGGSKPETGFDCSGIVQWAYAQQGIQTGRTTYDQIDAPVGKMVGRDDLQPGDAVFFKSASGDVHHVGISMGGDRFLHAPHTGDVVKVSDLKEPYYAQQFAGGRRFDESAAGSGAAPPAPAAVEAAKVAVVRDAVAARQQNSMVFKALSKQEASHHNATVQFMKAVQPEPAAPAGAEAVAAAAAAAPVGGSLDYPGNTASKEQLARWLAAHAEQAGLPPELPVMAALTESGLFNNPGGDADSVGYFQMRASIWNSGDYVGYYENPNLQAKWFIDHALDIKSKRGPGFGTDPGSWGNWIADVEQPAAQYRGRYQTHLEEARRLLGRG